MNVKASLGKVRTWLWLGGLGIMSTIVHSAVENSKLPDWVSTSAAAVQATASEWMEWLSLPVTVPIGQFLAICLVAAVLTIALAAVLIILSNKLQGEDGSVLSGDQRAVFSFIVKCVNTGRPANEEELESLPLSVIAREHAVEMLVKRGFITFQFDYRWSEMVYKLSTAGKAYHLKAIS